MSAKADELAASEEKLADLFSMWLRAQGIRRPLEELAFYVADLRYPVGRALARALHARGLCPDLPGARVFAAVMPANDLADIAAALGLPLKRAAARLRAAPPPFHVRILVANESAKVLHENVAEIQASVLSSSAKGVA